MYRRNLSLLFFVVLFLAGCPVPWDPLVGCADVDACSTSEPSTGGGETSTTLTPTTSEADASGSSAPPPDAGTPEAPPMILSVELPELPITTCGAGAPAGPSTPAGWAPATTRRSPASGRSRPRVSRVARTRRRPSRRGP
jgi:hypothetical protein